MRGRGARTSRRAFTLVELLATMTVLGIVGSVVAHILLTAVDGYAEASIRSRLVQECSIALERMTREVRTIGLDVESTGGGPDIDFISTDELEWSSNVIERIGTTIWLEMDDGDRAVLVDHVQSFEVEALDARGDQVSLPCSDDECDAIRRIGLSLTLSERGVTVTLQSQVLIRSTVFIDAG